jgi:hypothetical protein
MGVWNHFKCHEKQSGHGKYLEKEVHWGVSGHLKTDLQEGRTKSLEESATSL